MFLLNVYIYQIIFFCYSLLTIITVPKILHKNRLVQHYKHHKFFLINIGCSLGDVLAFQTFAVKTLF